MKHIKLAKEQKIAEIKFATSKGIILSILDSIQFNSTLKEYKTMITNIFPFEGFCFTVTTSIDISENEEEKNIFTQIAEFINSQPILTDNDKIAFFEKYYSKTFKNTQTKIFIDFADVLLKVTFEKYNTDFDFEKRNVIHWGGSFFSRKKIPTDERYYTFTAFDTRILLTFSNTQNTLFENYDLLNNFLISLLQLSQKNINQNYKIETQQFEAKINFFKDNFYFYIKNDFVEKRENSSNFKNLDDFIKMIFSLLNFYKANFNKKFLSKEEKSEIYVAKIKENFGNYLDFSLLTDNDMKYLIKIFLESSIENATCNISYFSSRLRIKIFKNDEYFSFYPMFDYFFENKLLKNIASLEDFSNDEQMCQAFVDETLKKDFNIDVEFVKIKGQSFKKDKQIIEVKDFYYSLNSIPAKIVSKILEENENYRALELTERIVAKKEDFLIKDYPSQNLLSKIE